MAGIEATEIEVFGRQRVIASLLRPLTGGRRAAIMFTYRGETVFVTVGDVPGETPVDEIIVSTKIPDIFFNYHEIWKKKPKNQLALSRCYFYLTQVNKFDESQMELLAVHFDSAVPTTRKNARFRRGPHMHVVAGDHPFKRSHIALCLQNLDETCSNLSALTTALGDVVEMVECEFLPHVSK